MKVEIVPYKMPPKQTRWGPVEQKFGLSYVVVDGKSAGYVPVAGEPMEGVFHPLAGFPEELCEQVVAASGGKLKSSLKPQPVHAVEEDEDDEPEEEEVEEVDRPRFGGNG